MPAAPLLGEGLVARRLEVPAREVVFVKAVLEASDGLGVLFAERGGALVIATPISQERDLDAWLVELAAEVGGRLLPVGPGVGPRDGGDRCDDSADPLA